MKALVLIILVSMLLLLGCSGGTPQNGGTGNPPSANPNAQQNAGAPSAPSGSHALNTKTPSGLTVADPEMKQIYQAALAVPPPATALDNIETAYSSQKISKEDYIVLSLQAIYDPSSVPSQYAGADLGKYEPTAEAMQAIDGWDSLSHVNLIVAIETRFGIIFSQKELLTFKNVGDLLNCIRSKIAV